ncbi:hypothetical protein GQ42DRAFT_161480 [Ramicandelaber brevisporus]|nr:hypothetical protein GQ42DRAFT_161480 [Ramicandelaber brevisporus]
MASSTWRSNCSGAAVGDFVRRRLPVLTWIPRLQLRRDFVRDLVAGLTISTFVMPQSMASALLAGLPPVYGLYSSVVPTLLYAILGTCPHMSTGTFAVTSIMLGQAAQSILITQMRQDAAADALAAAAADPKKSMLPLQADGGDVYSNVIGDDGDAIDQEDIVAMCLQITFWVGLIQLILASTGIARLIAKYLLPDALVSGFTTASAFHILTSQLGNFVGMDIPRPGAASTAPKPPIQQSTEAMKRLHNLHGANSTITGSAAAAATTTGSALFALPKQWFYVMSHWHKINFTTVVVGFVGIVAMFWLKRIEDQRAIKRRQRRMQQTNEYTPVDTEMHRFDAVEGTTTVTDGHQQRQQQQQQPLIEINDTPKQVRFRLNSKAIQPAQSTRERSTPPMSLPMRQGRTIDDMRTSARMRTRVQIVAPPRRQVRARLPSLVALIQQETPAEFNNNSSDATSNSNSNVDTDEQLTHDTISTTSSAGPHQLEEPVQHRPPKGNDDDEFRTNWIDWVPIPVILLTIIALSTLTFAFRLNERFNVAVLGHIPPGFPRAQLPPGMFPLDGDDVRLILPSALLISIIGYVVSITTARTFEIKHAYDVPVDETQEMVALGTSSLVGSMFSSYVSTGALGRSAVLSAAGARSHLANLIGAAVVIVTLLWFTRMFYYVPRTVLASVTIFACMGLFGQLSRMKTLYKEEKWRDFGLFTLTFVTVTAVSFEIGVAVGGAAALILAIIDGIRKFK